MKFIRVIPILLVAIGAQAQSDYRPGFVVNIGGDTLKGYVEYDLRSSQEKECKFRPAKNIATTIYRPGEISAYGFSDGRQYVTKTIPLNGVSQTVFMQRLQTGRANLYIFSDKFYLEKDSIILLPVPKKTEVNTDNGIYLRPDYRFVGILNVAFLDCPVELKRPSYELRWISKAVESYNRCNGTAVNPGKSKWSKVNTQLFLGLKYVSLAENSSGSNLSAFTPVAGAGIEVSSPAINDKLFFVAELLYYKILVQTSNEFVGPGYITRADYTSRSTNLTLPIGIRYNLLPENQTVYFKGGMSLNYTLNPSGSLITEREEAGIVTTAYLESTNESYQDTGFWLGAGFLKSFGPRLNCFLEGRVEVLESQTQLSLFAGLRF